MTREPQNAQGVLVERVPQRPPPSETPEETLERQELEGVAADALLRDPAFQIAYYETLTDLQDEILLTDPDQAPARESLYYESLALRRVLEKLNQARNTLAVREQQEKH